MRILRRDFLGADEVAAELRIGVDHLLKAPGLADHQIVGEQHCKGLVTDETTGAPHGMTQPQRLLLPHDIDVARRRTGAVERGKRFAAPRHRLFEFEGMVEMIFDQALAAAGHENELLDARLAGFIDRILNQGPVDDRKHFLWHRLGRRKEPGSKAADGEHGLAYLSHLFTLFWSLGSPPKNQLSDCADTIVSR